MVTEASTTLVKLYGHYKNRLLFVEGGLMNQPNTYLEAMEIIERIKAKT